MKYDIIEIVGRILFMRNQKYFVSFYNYQTRFSVQWFAVLLLDIVVIMISKEMELVVSKLNNK